MLSCARVTTVGIVGAYGATGAVIARQLAAAQPELTLLLGGRRPAEAEKLAAELGGDARAVAVDLEAPATLAAFCEASDLVVNCASPASRVGDKVARAALAADRDYLDPGGIDLLPAHFAGAEEVAARGRRFVVCAGWVPGVAELFARRVVADLDAIESLELAILDRSVWSEASCLDIIHYLLPREVGAYEGGRFTRGRSRRVRLRLPAPFGKRVMLPRQWDEIAGLLADRAPARAAVYLPADWRTLAFTRFALTFMRGREEQAARVVRAALNAETRLRGTMGAVVVLARGRRGGVDRELAASISFEGNHHYWMTGAPAALAAQRLLAGEVPIGLTALSDAVPPAAFLDQLAALPGAPLATRLDGAR